MGVRALIRRAGFALIPLTILVGDIAIRWDFDLGEQMARANAQNLPMSFAFSFGVWWSVALTLETLPAKARRVASFCVGFCAAAAVVSVWQYNATIHHDPNPGVIVYSLYEPSNTAKLARTGVTFGYIGGILGLGGLWSWLLLNARSNASQLIRRAAWLLIVAMLLAAFGWNDPRPDRETSYVSDIGFAVMVGSAIKRVWDFGTESILAEANRDEPAIKASETEVPHVAIFVGESLRRSRMSLYGADRPTSPNIDRWVGERADGVVHFDRGYAPSAFTPLAVAAIATGLYPGRTRDELHRKPVLWQYAHGLNGHSYVYSTQMWSWSNLSLYFLVNNPPQYWSHADEMEAPIVNDTGVDDRFAANVLREELVANPPRSGPALLMFQANSTHYPLFGDDEAPFEIRNRTVLYDAAVRITDQAFAIFAGALEEAGIADDTIVIFTSDHGEFDWDLVESKDPNRPIAVDLVNGERIESCHPVLTEIPLFVYVPPKWRARLGSRFAALQGNGSRVVSNVDIFSTVLDLWGQQATDVDGFSLLTQISTDRATYCFTNPRWARWLLNGYAAVGSQRYVYDREDFAHAQRFDPSDRRPIDLQLSGSPLNDADRKWRDAVMSVPFARDYLRYVEDGRLSAGER